jgi:hypothetical protein
LISLKSTNVNTKHEETNITQHAAASSLASAMTPVSTKAGSKNGKDSKKGGGKGGGSSKRGDAAAAPPAAEGDAAAAEGGAAAAAEDGGGAGDVLPPPIEKELSQLFTNKAPSWGFEKLFDMG